MVWLKENRILLIGLFLLLLINVSIYFKYFSDVKPDLEVSNVSYREEGNTWAIKVSSNQPMPGEQAEVVTVFTDGRVEKESWPLEITDKSWEYKRAAPPESVVINAPPEVDWDRNNSIYINHFWSRDVKLFTMPATGEYDLVLDKANKNFYLFYTEGFIKRRPQPGITLVGFDINGDQVFAPKNFAEDHLSNVRHFQPLISLTETEDQYVNILLGWNQFKDNVYSAKIYQCRLSREQNGQYELTEVMKKSSIAGRIYDSLIDQESGSGYLLTGKDRDNSMEWIIYRIGKQGVQKETVIPIGDTTLANIEISRLIDNERGRYLFWLEKKAGISLLKYMVVSPTGEILIPEREIGKAKIDYSIPEPFQVIGVDQAFHLVWVEKMGAFAPAHYINYLIIDDSGNKVAQRDSFVQTGGYTQGFDLSLGPGGNIEFVFTKYHGHKTFQAQRNTDIHWTKSRDLQQISPAQLLVGSSYYEKNPKLYYTEDNNRFLFWTRSKGETNELYYFTTDPELKKSLAEQSIVKLTRVIFNKGQDYVYGIITGLIFVFILSLLPLLGLFIYNLFGKYKKGFYLYWLGAVLTVFPLKLLTETLFIPVDNPVITRIFRLNLSLGLGVLLLIGIFWYITKGRKVVDRIEWINKILVCWVIIESFVVYLNFIRDVFRS